MKVFLHKIEIFCELSVGMKIENKKTESFNKNENRENKSVDEFQEYILQQKLPNIKVKAQSDMKVWNIII